MNIKSFDAIDNGHAQNGKESNRKIVTIVKKYYVLRGYIHTCIRDTYRFIFLLQSNMSPDHQIKIPWLHANSDALYLLLHSDSNAAIIERTKHVIKASAHFQKLDKGREKERLGEKKKAR